MKKTTWTIIRTIGFFIIGLMNTVLAKPEDIGTWKNYFGYLFIIIAMVDAFFLIRKFMKSKA